MEISIDSFEGPLDLLLHLIKENKMDIFNLKLELIVDQYLLYLKKQEQLNLEIASSYLVVASELIEIKSRLLLPKPPLSLEEEPLEEDLVKKLINYQQYKEITTVLKNGSIERQQFFTKLPDNLTSYMSEEITFTKDVSLDDLTDALQKFLKRKQEDLPVPTKITTREISVEQMQGSIKNRLKREGKLSFYKLFDVLTKEYIVATFLAILEMARQGELLITQEDNFNDIMCEVTS